MRVTFAQLAKRELDDTCRYYDLESPGLGERFKQEVRQALQRIVEYPNAWSVERNEVRRFLLHKFPFKLLYSVERDHIVVLAVGHLHRKPEYWIDRCESE